MVLNGKPHYYRDDRERMYKLITLLTSRGSYIVSECTCRVPSASFSSHYVLRFMLPLTIDISCNEYLLYMALVHCMNTIDSGISVSFHVVKIYFSGRYI